MVSRSEKDVVMTSAFDKFDMEPLGEPVTLRLKFRKTGDLQFISHLDLQRVMSRVLLRSGVPVWFTQGFNPHPKMVFAMPLGVGTQSECEYLDIKIDRAISPSEVKRRLNAQVTEEMRFIDAYYPDKKFSDIAYVKYLIDINCEGLDADISDKAVKLLTTSPLTVMKKTKSGEKEVDIADCVRSVSAKLGDTLKIAVTLKGGEGSLSPEMIVNVLKEKFGLLADYPERDSYTIIRTGLYTADGKEFR